MMMIGPYRVIGVAPERSLNPQRVILDTNVAIDIENFYFGTGSVDRSALRDLLLHYPNEVLRSQTVDLNYGWAVSEASWSRASGFDPSKARHLRYANWRVLAWTPDEVERAFANRHPPVNRDKLWPSRAVAMEADDDTPHPLPLLIGSYATLLYICHLDRTRSKWRGRGRTWPVERLIEWATEELGVRCAYELAAGARMFCGSPAEINECRRLLKVGGGESPDEIANKAWNAAWDMQFVRLTDGLTFGLTGLPDPPAVTHLVTRNIDPALIRNATRARAIVDDGTDHLVFVLHEYNAPADLARVIRQASAMDPLQAYWRTKRDGTALLQRAIEALVRLESDMQITRSATEQYLAAQ